jgi:spore maturation protein A
MLNYIWYAMIILAVLIAGGTDLYNELSANKITTGPESQSAPVKQPLSETTKLGQLSSAAFKAAATAVEIAIGLIGVMALWLGIVKVAEEAGLSKSIARLVRPLSRLLFPGIPADHPAISAMIMNVAANMLGLSNAATPLGLKAMEELQKLNPQQDTATDDMCMFLVINTTAITLIPATAIAVRAAVGSANPPQILIPSVLAASTATVAGIFIVKVIQRVQRKKNNRKGQPLS